MQRQSTTLGGIVRQLRIHTISTKYPSNIRQFYACHPNLVTQPYSDQHAALISESFGGSENRSTALQELGHRVDHLFSNVECLQKQWASENTVSYSENDWMLEITAAQIQAFRPEVLLFNNYAHFSAQFLRNIRGECSSIRLIIARCGAPYKDPSVFNGYDIVLTNIPEFVEQFRKDGHTSYLLPHSFDPRILQVIDMARIPYIDFAFIGSIIKHSGFHNEREQLILDLVEKTDIQLWLKVSRPSWKESGSIKLRQALYDLVHIVNDAGIPESTLAQIPGLGKALSWNKRPDLSRYVDSRILQRTHPPVFGLEMFQKLRDSKVVLNTHIDISPTSASNRRLFEATGVGACLLTDKKDDLGELFEPEVEVVTYSDSQECVEKVHYLLEHEEERKAIARRGQERTLKHYTERQRAEQINAIIHKHLS